MNNDRFGTGDGITCELENRTEESIQIVEKIKIIKYFSMKVFITLVLINRIICCYESKNG